MTTTIAELQTRVHEVSKAKGWWDAERTVGDLIALMHSELTEALEEFRNGRRPDEIYYTCQEIGPDGRVAGQVQVASPGEIPSGMLVRPEGVAVQLGDCVLRILDFCGRAGIDLAPLLEQKIVYNEQYRYSKKAI